jgi:peptidoglycan lytic transglycosylase G
MLRAIARLMVLLLALVLAAAIAANWAWQRFTGPGPLESPRTVIIAQGEGIGAIARDLTKAGVLRDPWTFRAGAALIRRGQTLKAGEYDFAAHISARAILDQLVAGTVVQHRLTVPEGLTSAQFVELLSGVAGLEGSVPPPPEGSILPETYAFTLGESRAALVARMQEAMGRLVAELWAKRAPDLPLAGPEEVVILASIVEKETAVASERPRVAAVFVNRLRRGMPLQSDPTVIYGLTHGKAASLANGEGILGRPLSRADLAVDDPYNTYKIPRLPPTPIANPGRAALEAAIDPATTNELYFVADGSGGHVFAQTLAEHNRNVQRWRKLQGGTASP